MGRGHSCSVQETVWGIMKIENWRDLVRRTIAVLWVLGCLSLLIRTLYFRSASAPLFQDVNETELYGMLALTSPLCGIGLITAKWIDFSWWKYPQNDSRTIVAIWTYFFVVGCIQWFIFVPWVIHKGFDFYDKLLPYFRGRRGGIR